MGKNSQINNFQTGDSIEPLHFEVFHNYRKVEKAKRRKLLRNFKIWKNMQEKSLKMNEILTQSECSKKVTQEDDESLWNVLCQDSMDFKYPSNLFFEEP